MTLDMKRPVADLSYAPVDDMFSAFYPNTVAGEQAWREMNAQECGEGGKVFSLHAAAVAEQLRAAGYTVEATPMATLADAGLSTDELMAELLAP